MGHRWIAIVLALALAFATVLSIPADLPVLASANRGIEVRGARYDRQRGVVTVRMRWLPGTAGQGGRTADHLVVLGRSGDGYVVVHDDMVQTGGERRTRHRIVLTRKERARLGGAATVLVAATHKLDEDGGRFDRAWYDARATGGDTRSLPTRAQQDCGEIEAGVDLAGCSFIGANLAYADLAGANLSGADLSSAIAAIADLGNANLDDAIMAGTYLSSATMTGVTAAGANASDADLTAAIMTGASLPGIDLQNAILTDAHLHQATLTDANLTGASMGGTDLSEANLTGADLSGADTSSTIFCVTTMPNGSINYYSC